MNFIEVLFGASQTRYNVCSVSQSSKLADAPLLRLHNA
jgi:hypothetical protein